MAEFYQNFKVGVLGGGQLGRMLIQSGIDLNMTFAVLDPDENAPCRSISEFTAGKLTDYDTVMRFGASCDLITVEIENVNTRALRDLAAAGKKVFPQANVLELIQDKREQKKFYGTQGIPTAPFVLTETRAELERHLEMLPAVHKLGREGYDGRGVQIIRRAEDVQKGFDAPGLLERFVDFEKEISVIVARSEDGRLSSFPPVEMVFHPEANLVEYLFSPARIDRSIASLADGISRQIITALNMVGVLAVEMFVTPDGKVLVNEIAPRPHNSGHQTIESNVTSQYEQHLRAILGLPMGDTSIVRPSAMVNVLGAEGYSGIARYEGLKDVLALPGAHVHLYGKKVTKPFRKMGHVTIVDADMDSLQKKAKFVRDHLKVIA